MNRIADVSALCAERNLDGILLAEGASIGWACGFSGDSSMLLVKAGEGFFITDGRYTTQAENETGLPVFTGTPAEQRTELARLLSKGAKLGIEKSAVTCAFAENIAEETGAELVDVSADMLKMRAVKTEAELRIMRRAAELTEEVLEMTKRRIEEGVTEQEILAELVYQMHMRGMEPSFPPIIASGENSALPHAGVTSRALKGGDLLTMDIGCKLEGYCTDITRTFAISGLEQRLCMVYNIVRDANIAGIGSLAAGVNAKDADAAARKVIEDAGYGKYFAHGTGHGVGAAIHEAPVLNARTCDVLSEGMVVTVEPGIYLPGTGGVRIEDMLEITADG